jgi:peroxiredoxin (alkyl hydroperoxide reductase subunit C)
MVERDQLGRRCGSLRRRKVGFPFRIGRLIVLIGLSCIKGEFEMPVKVGDSAPNFYLPQSQGAGDNIKLSDFKGKKNVLLCFYPFDFSPVCSEQLPAYSAQAERFEKANCEVMGISVDSPFSHAAWAEKFGIQFPLLSDFFGKEAVQAYGLMHEKGFSNRAVVLIDKEGKVVHAEVTAAPPDLPDDEKLFAALEKLS